MNHYDPDRPAGEGPVPTDPGGLGYGGAYAYWPATPPADYSAASYPPFAPPAGYPPFVPPAAGYPPFVPPAAGYPPFGDPAATWIAASRPAPAMAAAVLCYIESGLLVLAAFPIFVGAAALNQAEDVFYTDGRNLFAELLVNGFANFTAAALLIAGALLLTGGTAVGRVLITVAACLIGLEALWWTIRISEGVTTVWSVFFLLLPATAVGLVFLSPVSRWLDAVASYRASYGQA